MNAERSDAAPPGFLQRNPSAWLIAPTLALLGGQALAASPLRPPAYSLALLLLPLPFLFRRGAPPPPPLYPLPLLLFPLPFPPRPAARRWAIIGLVCGLAFAIAYRRHL